MSFGSNLKALISKATKEYTNIATKEPTIQSKDDNTSRGDDLDQILAQHATEKAALWDKLYQLENERMRSRDAMFHPPVSNSIKELQTLMTMDQHIVEKLEATMEKLDLEDRLDDTVLEIAYREKLHLEVTQLEQTLTSLKKELDQVKHAFESEKIVLKECILSNKLLKKVEDHYTEQLNGHTQPADRLAVDLNSLKKKYNESLEDMSDFLDEYYPPHPVDNANEFSRDECELKKIVEQLLNRAFTHPENPYLVLIPGTYWSPYIETLINARVAQYHPEDKSLLSLIDHTLY